MGNSTISTLPATEACLQKSMRENHIYNNNVRKCFLEVMVIAAVFSPGSYLYRSSNGIKKYSNSSRLVKGMGILNSKKMFTE